MSDILLRPMPTTDAEAEAMWDKMMAEMHLLNEKMRQDQIEIDRLKAETDAIKAESDHYKAETEKLRVQGEAFQAETQEILKRLKAQVNLC